MREIDGTAPSHQPVRILAIIVPTNTFAGPAAHAFKHHREKRAHYKESFSFETKRNDKTVLKTSTDFPI
jgi:hypothetical protein